MTAPLNDLRYGRLYLPSIEDPITEQIGSDVQSVGETSAVGQRKAKGFTLNFVVHGYNDNTIPVPVGNRMRRQLRSIMQNAAYRLAGLYMMFAPDTERNCWLVIGSAELADDDGGVTFGSYKLTLSQAFIVGQRQTHRDGYRLTLTDRRLTTSALDTLGQVINTSAWFAGQTAGALTYLPVGASDLAILEGRVPNGQRAGMDGVCPVLAGRADGDVVSWERTENRLNLGDVIVYDRRGNLGPFGTAGAYDIAPYVVNENYATDPSFAYDTLGSAPAGWATTGGPLNAGATLAVVSSPHVGGSQAMQVTTTNASASQGAIAAVSGLTNGATYTLSMYLKGAGQLTLGVYGVTSSNIMSTSSRAQYAVSFVASGTTAQINIRTQAAAAVTFTVDSVMVAPGGTLGSYGDGDQPGWIWTGTAGNSASEQLLDPQASYGWEEVYGPDYPWLQPSVDVPVIQNSHCRVRYDPSNTPGFRIDAWTGTAWAEQGKVYVRRRDASTGGAGPNPLNTLISSAISQDSNAGYTQDRAVLEIVMTASADPLSRERIYITLNRGWTGPRFEVYCSPGTDGTTTSVGADINYTTATAAANDSAIVVDTSGQTVATAGTGSALFPGGVPIGAGTFTGENWIYLLRQGQAYAVELAVLQATAAKTAFSSTVAYGGSAQNSVQVSIVAGGYLSVQLGLHTTAADQVNEAEAIRNTGSGTTSQVADATASGGQCVKDTQTAATNATLSKPSSTLAQAKYRIFARVKVDSGATGSFKAALGGVIGSVVTSTATTWTWIDLGDVLATAAGATEAVTGWRSAGGSGSVYIDRVELVKTEDRTAATCPYDGVRDHGQSHLYSSRVQVRRIARA